MTRAPRYIKVTQDEYFALALELLGTRGLEAMTIAGLCEPLGVTKGSFYHYFGSWSGFVVALVEHWERQQTDRVVDLAVREPDPQRRLAVLQHGAVALPHAAETAIRAWGFSDETVRAALERVDLRRHAAVRDAIVELGAAPEDAERLAAMGLALLVGVQQVRRPVNAEALGAMFDELQRLIQILATTSAPRGG